MKNVYENAILKNSYVIKTNRKGKIVFVNNNYLKRSGYEPDELLYSYYTDVAITDNNFKFEDAIKHNKEWKGIVKTLSKDGQAFYIDTQINPIYDDQGKLNEILAFGHDVSEYIDLMTYDKLTGLKNREILAKDLQTEKPHAIAVINLDSFSEVNEFYGGYIGDQVIISTAKRLVEVFSKQNVYRLQSDEFVILKQLPEYYDKHDIIESFKNPLKSLFEESLIIEDIELPVTVTAGMYVGHNNFLRNANIAYKNSKKKNMSFSIYSDEMYYKFADFSHNKKVASSIKEAIKEDLVTPYYQPIIDNKTKQVVKYEALARLVNEEDVLMPSSFIDVSKKIKYYHKITRAMLYKSFNDFSRLGKYELSFNITLEDIANTRTFAFIVEQLRQNKNNSFITFEIVESEGIEDFKLFDKFVQTVKRFGAKISIDDFGTGYSNFSYLAKLEPDFLKIDGSLIKNIEDKKDFDVVKTIISFAKMYNIKTIAEFVENEDIFILVQELGIDYSQGYYFSKPLPFEQISKN